MKATMKDEYVSLRAELQEHQTRRLAILTIAITITTAIFTVAIQLNNPYLPILALLVQISARLQLIHANEGTQRIASYIRIFHEEKGSHLHWETGSYERRSKSGIQAKGFVKTVLKYFLPFSVYDFLIAILSLAAIILSLLIILQNGTPLGFTINSIVGPFNFLVLASVISLFLWIFFCGRADPESLESREDTAWQEFKKKLIEPPISQGESPLK